MQVKNYDPVVAILRNALLSNPDIVALVGDNIRPDYIDAIENPTYPCITILADESQTFSDTGFTEEPYYIHGWTDKGPDEAAYLFNLIVATLDLNPPPELLVCRKVQGKKNLYDSEIKKHYSMVKFLIYASPNLIYKEETECNMVLTLQNSLE